MATFENAIPVILAHEGGIANIGDGCGTTNFGFTPETCKALGVAQPTDAAEASDLYRRFYWSPLMAQIQSQNVATKVFDFTVNSGAREAMLVLQRALCAAGSIVAIDGALGSNTVAATNLVPDQLLLPWMRLYQFVSYETDIKINPDLAKFRNGFANRAAWPDPDGTIAAQLLNATYRPPVPGGNINAQAPSP